MVSGFGITACSGTLPDWLAVLANQSSERTLRTPITRDID